MTHETINTIFRLIKFTARINLFNSFPGVTWMGCHHKTFRGSGECWVLCVLTWFDMSTFSWLWVIRCVTFLLRYFRTGSPLPNKTLYLLQLNKISNSIVDYCFCKIMFRIILNFILHLWAIFFKIMNYCLGNVYSLIIRDGDVELLNSPNITMTISEYSQK